MIIGGWKLKYKKPRKKKPSEKKFFEYKRRNLRLSDMGYTTYQEYLESDDWAKLRAERLLAFPKCLLCSSPASQVHHLSYAVPVLLGLVPQLLVGLCDPCHTGIEFTDDKQKRTLEEANKELRIRAMRLRKFRWAKMVKREFNFLIHGEKARLRRLRTKVKSTKCLICNAKYPRSKRHVFCTTCVVYRPGPKLVPRYSHDPEC